MVLRDVKMFGSCCLVIWVIFHLVLSTIPVTFALSLPDGFRKVVAMDGGMVVPEKNTVIEFQHVFFKQGEENLLENIKRKVCHLAPALVWEGLPGHLPGGHVA